MIYFEPVSFIGCIPLSGLKICCVGAIFFDDCPAERFIPIYLIVGGVFSFWGFLSALVQSVYNLADPNRDHSAFSKLCRVTDTLVGFFTFAWFIAGNLSSIYLSQSLSLSVSVYVCMCCVVFLWVTNLQEWKMADHQKTGGGEICRTGK